MNELSANKFSCYFNTISIEELYSHGHKITILQIYLHFVHFMSLKEIVLSNHHRNRVSSRSYIVISSDGDKFVEVCL